MRVIAFLIAIGIFSCVQTQENALRKLSSGLLECYNSSFVVLKDNHLPYTMDTFIAILRKIEDSPSFNMDLRQFTVSLLHRFRQDGIIENTESKPALGVIPYASNSFQFYKNAAILKLIQGNALHFPNSSISLLERCTLHFILSSTIDFKERGDESITCQTQNSQYRWKRNIDKGTGDVETLSPEELEIIKKKNNESKEGDFGPNSFYPVLPPNHPENAQYKQSMTSKCPLESGIIHTKWGTVAGGTLLAGIAAALQPEKIRISDFRNWRLNENLSDVRVDNKWLATLAGDLAEVVIRQGPFKNLDERFQIGIEGHWNSTVSQKYYFLNEDENFLNDVEFTAAEVRGDLDGLILANTVMTWYQSIPSLRLSQIFDMYYSDRGLFNVSTRACDRRALLTSVAPNDTTSAQVYAASLALLLENCEINKYASNFTLINAFDGNVLINSSNSILDFYNFNETQYSSLTMFKNGFDLPKSLEVLKAREEQKLNREWESKIGGQRSEIVLILPSATASISDSDKNFCLDRLKTLRETVPDATLLFLTPGSKDKWAEMTVDSVNDIVSFSNGNTKENSAQIINLVNRMKQEPERCRYPDMTKYTISYENLVCVCSASSAIISPIVYFITIMYIYTRH
ncbi:hypothetical protein G9C98_007768 [Cotesia typhae]|uniref:Uncharacterized protein n=1 Tax=Cotesia typhae TaxID=2053667 RepID=A0A8J5QT35_9HYME|nr:hypothetical protein G9C98_007768 [Cotesia typhae]